MVQSRKFRGVRQRHWGSWVSEIRHPLLKRRVWLGTFDTAEEAAKVYDEAAILMSGRNAKTNFALTQNSVLSKGISEILHAKLKKSSKTPSPSLTCLRLDTENSHIGVWQKPAGVCSDSNWIMRVEFDHHHIYNSPAQQELVLMNTTCSSSSPSSSTSVTTDEEHSLALEMIQELLNPNYIN